MPRYILFLVLSFVLFACSPKTQQTAQLPTVASIPTQAITPTEIVKPTIQATREQASTPVISSTSISTLEPTAEPDNQLIFTNDNNVTMEVERFEQRSTAGNYTPANDIYIVMFANFHNGDDSQRCVYARDVRLVLDGQEYAPQGDAMGAVRETLDPQRDYIGAIQGQCFEVNTTVPTFAVFDVPKIFETSSLIFYGSAKSVTSVWLDSSAEIASVPTIQSSVTDQPIATDVPDTAAIDRVATNAVALTQLALGATPSATITETIEPTSIPPTNAPAETWYTAREANLRECPQLDCARIVLLPAGSTVTVIGTVQGETYNSSDIWRKLTYNGRDAFVHSSLISVNRPVPTSVPVQQVQPQPQAPLQNQSVPSTWTCSGNIYNCGDFNTCAEVMAYFNACPGDPSGLDQGGRPGIPCENLC